jgi:hypothetical protein
MIKNAFWALSDNKTVRELGEKEYLKLLGRNRLVGYVDETIICLVKGPSTIVISMKQFKQILSIMEKAKL